jgi:hypothetical protein
MKNQVNMSEYVVRNESGMVDVEGTVRKFHSEVQAFVSLESNSTDKINGAVNAVFDREPSGKAIAMESLIHSTLVEMQVGIDSYQQSHKMVHNFIRNNSSNERSDGCLFKISLGYNGGVRRWTDYQEEVKPAKKTSKK